MSQYAFYFNADKCIGCKSCIIACKDKKNLKPGHKFRRVFACAGGSWNQSENNVYIPDGVYSYSVSLSCNHCHEPACVNICPAGAAIKRDDGIVYIDQDACIGCKMCFDACPYKVPSYDPETNKTDKCDFCRELMHSEDEKPVCVTSCLMRALDCGEYSDLLGEHPESDVTIKPLPENTTKPSIVITPHRRATSDAIVINMDEETYASYGYKNKQ